MEKISVKNSPEEVCAEALFQSKVGTMKICCTETVVRSIDFVAEGKCSLASNELCNRVIAQLGEYFAGQRREFDFPLAPLGTPFQQKVWKALLSIPYGETRSYKQLAVSIGNPKACRAVGLANNHNPIAIAIPCHRVVGSNGALVGYASGIDKKKMLLDLERGDSLF